LEASIDRFLAVCAFVPHQLSSSFFSARGRLYSEHLPLPRRPPAPPLDPSDLFSPFLPTFKAPGRAHRFSIVLFRRCPSQTLPKSLARIPAFERVHPRYLPCSNYRSCSPLPATLIEHPVSRIPVRFKHFPSSGLTFTVVFFLRGI